MSNKQLYFQRRRARDIGKRGDITHNEWCRAKFYFKSCCCYCGQPCFGCLTVEHWQPLSDPDCPGTTVDNILPACNRCNNAKDSKPPEQWIYDTFDPLMAADILQRITLYFRLIERMI